MPPLRWPTACQCHVGGSHFSRRGEREQRSRRMIVRNTFPGMTIGGPRSGSDHCLVVLPPRPPGVGGGSTDWFCQWKVTPSPPSLSNGLVRIFPPCHKGRHEFSQALPVCNSPPLILFAWRVHDASPGISTSRCSVAMDSVPKRMLLHQDCGSPYEDWTPTPVPFVSDQKSDRAYQAQELVYNERENKHPGM